jgi:SAM-dependent methyltransferase
VTAEQSPADESRAFSEDDFVTHKGGSAETAGRLNRAKFVPFVAPTDSVLEFGCGGGWMLKGIDAAEKVGVEPNPTARDVSASNGIEVYASISEVPERQFTRIISNHFLEHLPDPVQSLRELRDLLAPDGRLILVVPIDDWRVQKRIADDVDHHLQTWTPPLLANTLTEAGFTPLSVTVLTHAWPIGWDRLSATLPPSLFDGLCRTWAIVFKRRQLVAVAKPYRLT